MEDLNLPAYADVVAASERIKGHAHRTPVMTSRTINAELGAEVYFKCENLQRTGAFKCRGAYNALSQFSPEQKQRGVVAELPGHLLERAGPLEAQRQGQARSQLGRAEPPIVHLLHDGGIAPVGFELGEPGIEAGHQLGAARQ